MFNKVLVLTLVGCVCLSSASLPFINKCKSSDSKCLKDSANAIIPIFVKGLKEYGVNQLELLSLKEPIDSSVPSLKIVYRDIKISGLNGCTIESIYRTSTKLGGKILCPAVSFNGQYDMEGKLLVLNVKGNGDIKSVLKKILITIDVDVEDKIGKDGKKHWDLKRFTHSFELLDKSEIEFQNLQTGSDVLDRAATEVITANSNDIIKEIGHPVIKAAVVKVIENIRRFFQNIPVEDLSLD